MKNSFRLVALLGLCASLTLPVLAQPGAGGGKMGGPGGKMGGRMGGPGGGRMRGMGGMRGMGRMVKELGLTAAQQAKMKTIMDANRPAMMALFQNKSMSEAEKRTKMRAMGAANAKKMMAILTPAQRAKVTKMQAEQRAGRGPGGGGRM